MVGRFYAALTLECIALTVERHDRQRIKWVGSAALRAEESQISVAEGRRQARRWKRDASGHGTHSRLGFDSLADCQTARCYERLLQEPVTFEHSKYQFWLFALRVWASSTSHSASLLYNAAESQFRADFLLSEHGHVREVCSLCRVRSSKCFTIASAASGSKTDGSAVACSTSLEPILRGISFFEQVIRMTSHMRR
jgi:hypothetical protein